MAADEIGRFRREMHERSGNVRSAADITVQELLREVMNTVGKSDHITHKSIANNAEIDVI